MFERNPDTRKFLKDKSIMLVGLGSVGSAMGEMLYRSGVGNLDLVDPDRLEEQNLERHILGPEDLQQFKVVSLTSRWPVGLAFAEKFAPSMIKGDLIISSVDSYQCESLVNAASLETGIPALFIGCWGSSTGEMFARVEGGPCLECYSSFRAKSAEVQTEAYTDPTIDTSRVPGQPGLWANILTITGIAFHMAMGILDGSLDKPLWLFNIEGDYSLHKISVKKGCCICDESLVDDLTI